jgi:hypothetical protein
MIRHDYGQFQPEVAVNINAILASETDFFNLSSAGRHYIVDNMFLKSADPGAGNSVIVRLYKLVNGVLTVVNAPIINIDNLNTYFSLMSLFGLPNLAGDNLKVTVQQQVGGGPTAITGSYSFRSN